MLWLAAFLLMGALTIGAVIYLVSRFRRFLPENVIKERKVVSWILAVAPVALIGLVFYVGFNITTMMVVILHMILIWLLCDFVAFLIKKISKKQIKNVYIGVAALFFTVIYLGSGWYFAHHVYQTNYEFSTTKDLGHKSIRVVEIADSHLSITLKGEDFAEQMKRVQETNPDVVLIAGDFVDDDTDKEDMLEACRALGELKTTYGVYFVFGNHDEGYFKYRNFTAQELRTALTENNVTILEDEAVLIDDSFYVVGRKDRSMLGRLGTKDLVANLDQSKYMIVIDHQPNDYAGEAEANVDLVLSGHTHGGHIFPTGYIGLAIKANDRVYGTEQRGNTNFVVSSGISGWAIPFKTGTISEYVVIDITME